MKKYRYVVEYNNALYVIEVDDWEENNMVIVDVVAEDYVARYVNEGGKDRVGACFQELCFTNNDDVTIEDFIAHVSFVLGFGEVLAVLEVEKRLVIKR